MNSPTMQPGRRARSEDAKFVRRGDLLAAARRRLLADGYDGFTMAELASEAKVAKGTAYLYFTTREEILLTILTEDYGGLFMRLQAMLDSPTAPSTPEGFAALFYTLLCERPTFLPLLQIVQAKLERNVSNSALKVYKFFLMQGVLGSAEAIEKALGLKQGDGLHLFIQAHALAVGLSQMVDRAPAVERLYDESPDLHSIQYGFESEFVMAVTSLIAARLAA
jgi:AcrR family transcriptional regulator